MYNMEHQPLPDCIRLHTELVKDRDYQHQMLEEIKCDVKEIKQELVAQKDRMWGLYVKIIIIACMSGAGLLKLVL